MNKKRMLSYLIVISAALIVFAQFIVAKSFSHFRGTDDQSVDLIKEIAPNYTPWANNIWEHQYDWSENLIFAMQAALGLGVLVFYIIKQRQKTASAA